MYIHTYLQHVISKFNVILLSNATNVVIKTLYNNVSFDTEQYNQIDLTLSWLTSGH